jgi:hypothetical protein
MMEPAQRTADEARCLGEVLLRQRADGRQRPVLRDLRALGAGWNRQ